MTATAPPGSNVEEARRAVDLIARAAATTATPAVLGGVGGFGSLFRFDPSTHPDPVLVASTDGVGTKLKVAIELGRYDSIGIDLVHHCINDIAVQGADPLFFLDYLAVGRLRAEVAAEIVAGIANACAASGVALVGGETAELPDLYHGDDFDLAGFIVGVVARADVIDGSAVRAGDALLGLPSSGLHTNGYSLARRIFSEDDRARSAPGPGAHHRGGAARAASVLPRRDPDPASRAARRRRATRWPSPTSPAAAGSTTSRAPCRSTWGSRSSWGRGRCRASSA